MRSVTYCSRRVVYVMKPRSHIDMTNLRQMRIAWWKVLWGEVELLGDRFFRSSGEQPLFDTALCCGQSSFSMKYL